MTEHAVAQKIFYKWHRSDIAAHNINLFDFESDVLVLKPSGYLIEYEIKLSVSDFRADFRKKRKVHRHQRNSPTYTRHEFILSGKGANRFYYALPDDIYKKVKDEIPPWAGILTFHPREVDGKKYVIIGHQRNAKLLHKKTFGNEAKSKILTAMYWKAWRKI